MNDEANNWFEVPGRATAVSLCYLEIHFACGGQRVCVCVYNHFSESSERLCVTGESWSHFDGGELTVLWLASAASVRSTGLSHTVQMRLFNQLLLNHMWGKSPKTHASKNQEPFSEHGVKSDDLQCCVLIRDHLVRCHSTQKCVNSSHLTEHPEPQRMYWGLLSRRPDSPHSFW